jgi:hypothetical protein
MPSPTTMQNLTLASAQHLMNQGHITPAHHAKIKAAAMKMPKMAFAKSPAPKLQIPKKPVANAFGALGGPQQAQGPVPGVPGVPGMGGVPGAPTALPGLAGLSSSDE